MASCRKSLCCTLLSLTLLFLLLLLVPTTTSTHLFDRKRFSIESIFQFGDSLSDTGNLIRDSPTGASNQCGSLPYGQTLRNTTGRCSDGLLMVDFFAKYFRLPLLSPYLDKEGNFNHGVNFAVAGSTALDVDALAANNVTSPVTNSSLSVQLEWFKSYLHSKCQNISDCKESVRNSLVIMGEIGGNDYNYALLQNKTMEELRGMVPEVVHTIKEAVEEVISHGADKIVVSGNFPIGCMPIYLSLFENDDSTMYDELKCLKHLNEFAAYHNHRLQQVITELQQEYPGVSIVYGDYYSGLRWILTYARFLGFNEGELQIYEMTDNKYNFNVNKTCRAGVPVCANPEERFSWDGIHLTQHAYFHIANYFMKLLSSKLFYENPVIVRIIYQMTLTKINIVVPRHESLTV